MSFRISISPQRKRSSTGMPQSARPMKSSLNSTLVNVVEEIKNMMKQLTPQFQNLLNQLIKIAFDLEKQNTKFSNALQSYKASSIQNGDLIQKEPSSHQDRNKSKDCSPIKRECQSKNIEMTSSSRLDPTPKQKFLIRRSSLDVDQQVSKDQLRKISQEAIDQNFIINLLDFKPSNLKSMSYKKLIQIFTLNEKDLYQYLQKIEYQGIYHVVQMIEYLLYLFEPLKFAKDLSEKCIIYIEKLKKIIKLSIEIQQFTPSQTFESYQKLLLELFECDRAQVYLYDSKFHIFWTKGQDGQQKAYYPFKGILGFVTKQGQILNINDVYQDVRFDQDYDLKQQNKTKSMLACPLYEKEEIIGVIIISSVYQQFKREDEILIQMVSQLAAIHFYQYVFQEYNTKTCETLQQILKFSLILQQSVDQKQFMILAQQILSKTYELKQVQIYFKDMQDKEALFTFVEQHRKKVPKTCGIIGYVYKTGQFYVSDSCYRDRYFNKLADIETNLPTITIPIKNEDKCMGAIQYIDTKGIDNFIGKQLKNYQLSNLDLIQIFAGMLNFVNSKLIIQKY
ncbi:unnamed protein product (macronuclear) [Paramecium tetraurelia]|uniref:GAF domain-containing protein n=1 Tax=Paramecium tetraurelia TaxID=5888 RepID=A0EDW1_PARTE|nr:uncharacterized protein GSPATT00025822001 [Paramecium tetraurelia]CAK93478.1 unnamed protein product [Paramecium tetraurelia]|eukprot:XP_001460875.1 hypothetical protein (macronuclear) [Paramecium tetraurelia strain d4-2]